MNEFIFITLYFIINIIICFLSIILITIKLHNIRKEQENMLDDFEVIDKFIFEESDDEESQYEFYSEIENFIVYLKKD